MTSFANSGLTSLSEANVGGNVKRYGLRSKRAPLSSIGNGSNPVAKSAKTSLHAGPTSSYDSDDVTMSDVQQLVTARPANVRDIDADQTEDAQMVAEYAQEIHGYMIKHEQKLAPDVGYMAKQEHINAKMRGVLIDWLVEVHLRFDLLPETLFLTTLLIDRYLSVQSVSKSKLQLVGVTAMLLASKYEEMWPPEIQDFVYMTDNAYSKSQIIEMELIMGRKLNFSLGNPLPTQFLGRYARAGNACESTVNVAIYAMELAQTQYNMIQYRPSMMAASGLAIGRAVMGYTPWDASLQYYSGYTLDNLQPCIQALNKVLKESQTSVYKASRKKHAKTKYMATSSRKDLAAYVQRL